MRIVIDTSVIGRKAVTAIQRVQAIKPVQAVRDNADIAWAALAGCAAWEGCEFLLNTVGMSFWTSATASPLTALTGWSLFWYIALALVLAVSAVYVIDTMIDRYQNKGLDILV